MQDLYHQQQCIVGSCFRRLRRLRRRLPQETPILESLVQLQHVAGVAAQEPR